MTRANGGQPDLTPWLNDLCTALIAGAGHEKAHTMLIASAFRGAGRSTVAANIATYFAGGGARVLLIEAYRAASADACLRFGLLDVLESGENLRGAFVEDTGEAYTILPFGGEGDLLRPASISALISGMAMRATLKLCREWFEIVVIDGPPVLEAGYARLLAQRSDRTVFVAEWNKTSPSEVNEAINRLDVENAILFFNKVDVARLRLLDPAQARQMAQIDELGRAA